MKLIRGRGNSKYFDHASGYLPSYLVDVFERSLNSEDLFDCS
ncbi:hypothetical protein [Candidatus Nitrosocosmicus arcticus]|nr:hypothetical protein [Candidatus Nitrosocosmicus arcticus]